MFFACKQMDDLFDDDEAAPPAKEETRAQKMAAAKAAKDAKKKIDRQENGRHAHKLTGRHCVCLNYGS